VCCQAETVHTAPLKCLPHNRASSLCKACVTALQEKAERDQQRERLESIAPRLRAAFITPSGNNATQQFLENDGKVLRFYAGRCWMLRWARRLHAGESGKGSARAPTCPCGPLGAS
jgi:hypothetical protein